MMHMTTHKHGIKGALVLGVMQFQRRGAAEEPARLSKGGFAHPDSIRQGLDGYCTCP
jgi:hypothetical protein